MTSSYPLHRDSFARDHLPPEELWPRIEFTTPELQYPAILNAATELIDVPVATFGSDRVAVLTPDGASWTYGELLKRANQVAQFLSDELRLVPGSRVLLRSPNNPWAMASWLGVLKAGLICVTTFSSLRARELEPIIAKTSPSVALVDHRFVDDLAELVASTSIELPLIVIGGEDPDGLIARCETKSGVFENIPTASDDVALFCPTSGSTGVPKVTVHFHRDLLSIDITFAKPMLGLVADDVVSCTAPMAFTFGLGMLAVFPLRVGASSLLTEALAATDLADLVEELGVTVLATAPTAYRQIIAAGKVHKLAGLRAAVSAGEHIPASTWNRLRDELGLRVIDGIGATELLHIFISSAGDDIRPGATGKPLPGYRATILDDDGHEVGPDVEGRLAVIGPVGCRYLDDDRQKNYVVNGWNVTGDTFVRDADGYFWYRARSDNMIISSGYNIGGPEVEAALDEHPDVVESAVVGRPDEERGSVVTAFVVLRPGVVRDADTVVRLQRHVKSVIAPYKYPREIRFVDSLPRNTSGKLQHFLLRKQLVTERSETSTTEQDAPS